MSIILQREEGDVRLQVWSDVDWERDQSNRRSRTCALMSINSVPNSWTSRRQTAVSMSTSEAKFNALADNVRNTACVCAVRADLGQPQK